MSIFNGKNEASMFALVLAKARCLMYGTAITRPSGLRFGEDFIATRLCSALPVTLSSRLLPTLASFEPNIDGEYPILVWRPLPAIQADQLFNVLLVSVRNNERVQNDLALYLGNPVTNVLHVGYEK